MSILFINPLASKIKFLIFTDEGEYLEYGEKNLETSSTFPRQLIDIVDKHHIEEIWCVTGPGPFTLLRIVTLAINALTYTRTLKIRFCHFFELIDTGHTPILEANTREYLIRQSGEDIEVIKEDLPSGKYCGYAPKLDSTELIKYIEYKESREDIERLFTSKASVPRLSPIYIKPPHITCPKR